MRKLPSEFQEKMIRLLGEAEFSRFREVMDLPMEHGLRVNSLKISAEEFKNLSLWELSMIPWCKTGFYLSEDAAADPPSKNPYYYAGAYYLQEPSAMLPAAALPVKPGDRVLDLCAAPGGKSTALAEKLRGEGVLVCNDISATRAKALIKNLELFGVTNAVVTAETPEKLAGVFAGYFDKILIDAPCSGEGMFRKSAAMVSDWTPEKPKEYAAIQREILPHAIRMLCPGGMLLYSTCTYSPEEDEEMVQFILDLPEAKEKGIALSEIPFCEGFLPGNPDWISAGAGELKKTVHMMPHRVRGEGHFAALFASGPDGNGTLCDDNPAGGLFSGNDDLSVNEQLPGSELLPICRDRKKLAENLSAVRKKLPEFAEFAGNMNILWDLARIRMKDGYLSYMPKAVLPSLAGLRIMRQGLFLGEVKKNRFEPSQALAMALSPETFTNTLSLSYGDERVMRYLRGETISYEEEGIKNGWVLISLDNLPLGFGKADRGNVKNKYLPGWRVGA